MAQEFLPAPAIHRYSMTQYPLAARSVSDGVLNTTTTVTSATAAFTSSDVGATIVGTGIPALATIASVTNATTVVISAAATATASGVTLTITRTNALALAVFQTAYQADISVLASVQVLAYTAAPTVAVIIVPSSGQVLSVSPGQWLGYNFGNWAVLSSSQLGRVVTDAVTNGTTTVTSATAAFAAGDVGAYIATPNLRPATTIISVTNSTTVVVSAAATASASAQTMTISPLTSLFTPDVI